jgi:hypothetical protein
MPARGTHSLVPSSRGRGLRFSGSLSKVASTQSAIASASAVMLLALAECGGRGSGEPGGHIPACSFKVTHCGFTITLSQLPVALAPDTYSALVHHYYSPSSPCKRLVSHVHASAVRRFRGTAHRRASSQEPPRKDTRAAEGTRLTNAQPKFELHLRVSIRVSRAQPED